MPNSSNDTSYQLSEEAQELLGKLAGRLGLTKTSVVEMAIRKLVDGTMADAPRSEADLQRHLCHSLIDYLRDRGLPEAVETLTDMVRFYENPPPPYRILPRSEPIPADWGETRVRPVYPVTEEE